MLYFLSLLFTILCLKVYESKDLSCKLKYEKTNSDMIEVYWINMNTSVDRKHMMENHFNFYNMVKHSRVNAVTPSQIHLPPKIAIPQQCKQLSENRMEDNVAFQPNMTQIFVSAHCGRPKNSPKELSVTISHLYAMYQSFRSISTKYALIMEDDLQFAHEIDFDALIASAPDDFVILQLITSNDHALKYLWKLYTKQKVLWIKHKESDDYWCAGAYIINKDAMMNILSSIITPILPLDHHKDNSTSYNLSTTTSLLDMKIIAGYKSPCTPKHCCRIDNVTTKAEFVHKSPCIKAARGYQADHYLFQLAPQQTYMLTVPIFLAMDVGNQSTLHQDHVSMHQVAFNRMREYVQIMSEGSNSYSNSKEVHSIKLPQFLNKHCSFTRKWTEDGRM